MDSVLIYLNTRTRAKIDCYITIQASNLGTVATKTFAFPRPSEQENTTMIKSLQQELAYYVRENMAKVNIYIRDPYVKRFITEEKITEISFTGTVGGLLGLFLGFSFMSIFEVIYCVFFNVKKRDREETLANKSVDTWIRRFDNERMRH